MAWWSENLFTEIARRGQEAYAWPQEFFYDFTRLSVTKHGVSTSFHRSDFMSEPPIFEEFSERRQFPRKPISLSLTFAAKCGEDIVRSQKITQTQNISASGLALYSELELRPDDKLNLTLYLPPQDKRRGDLSQMTWEESETVKVSIQGRIVWQMPFIGSKYAYGVEFTAIAPASKSAFQEFLNDFDMHIPNFAQ